MNKKHLLLLASASIALLFAAPCFATFLYPTVKTYSVTYSTGSAPPFSFTLLNQTTNAPITNIDFGQVSPGLPSSYTCTLTSTMNETVWMSYNPVNIPSGAVVYAFWNGPGEQWNATVGRQWNTVDNVTLIFDLFLPVGTALGTKSSFNMNLTSSFTP